MISDQFNQSEYPENHIVMHYKTLKTPKQPHGNHLKHPSDALATTQKNT